MKILDTEKILEYQRRTVKGAKSRLIIISPYIQIDNYLLKSLMESSEKGVGIILICGKTALKKDEREKLSKINKLELFFLPELHAKCIINDDFAILSSMNLYDASKTNFELGCLISKQYDNKVYTELETECFKIYQNSKQYRIDLVRR